MGLLRASISWIRSRRPLALLQITLGIALAVLLILRFLPGRAAPVKEKLPDDYLNALTARTIETAKPGVQHDPVAESILNRDLHDLAVSLKGIDLTAAQA